MSKDLQALTNELDLDQLDFDSLDNMAAPGAASIEKVEASFSDLPTVLDKIKTNMKAQQEELDKQATLLHPYQEIHSDDDLKAAKSDVRDVNRVLKDIKEMRLNTTRPLDTFKKELIKIEREITENLSGEIDRVKELCDSYEIEQERKRQEQIRKVRREETLKVLRIRTKAEIDKSLAELVDEYVTKLDESIQQNVLNWTLSDFDKNVNQLKSLKPKLPAAMWNGTFGIHPSSEEREYITIDDCDQILMELKNDEDLSYELTQMRYERKGQDVINTHLVRMDEYRSEVEMIEKKRKENAEEARKIADERKARAEKEAAARRERDRLEAQRRTEALEEKRKQDEAQARIDAMSQEQEIGNKEVSRRLISATATPKGYLSLLQFYLRTGGDQDKLKFLITHAINNGRPKLEGVNYNL